MDQTGIRMTDVGKFTIQYLKNNIKKIHYLDFGNNYKMSSCSCYTWKKSAYPCKHFFCSFSESCCLSGLYRNSPYLNLDDFDSSIQTGDFLQNNCAVINDEHKRQNNDSKTVQTENRSYKSLPKASSKKIYKGNMGESCRSLLNEIRSFTFLVEDN